MIGAAALIEYEPEVTPPGVVPSAYAGNTENTLQLAWVLVEHAPGSPDVPVLSCATSLKNCSMSPS